MRRHVSEQLRFRISCSPSLFNVPFLPYQKLSSISITIHPFRSLLLLLPAPATTQDQSPKRVRQPSFRNFDSKNSFDRSWLKDISVPFDPVRPTLSFDRCESPSSLASKNGKVFRREREKRNKKKHSLRLRIAWLINRNLVEIEICRETIIRAIEKNRIGVDSGGSVPRLHPRYLDTCNGQPESRFAVVDCVEPWIVRGVGKWPRSLEVGV